MADMLKLVLMAAVVAFALWAAPVTAQRDRMQMGETLDGKITRAPRPSSGEQPSSEIQHAGPGVGGAHGTLDVQRFGPGSTKKKDAPTTTPKK